MTIHAEALELKDMSRSGLGCHYKSKPKAQCATSGGAGDPTEMYLHRTQIFEPRKGSDISDEHISRFVKCKVWETSILLRHAQLVGNATCTTASMVWGSQKPPEPSRSAARFGAFDTRRSCCGQVDWLHPGTLRLEQI